VVAVAEPQVLERQEAEAPECRHHWVIETPRGATSNGVCKLCSAVREFRNAAPDTLWEGDPLASAGRMGGGGWQRPLVREISSKPDEA
jgi:hypothetical protein